MDNQRGGILLPLFHQKDPGLKRISVYIVSLVLPFFLTGLAFAAGTNSLLVSATVLSKSQCKFNSATSTLNFGTVNGASSTDVTASTSITYRCLGSAPIATYAITQDSGLYQTGPSANRMRHSTIPTEYLPYTLTLNPVSGTVPKNTPQTLTMTGTLKAVDYQTVAAGAYSDSVVVTIAP